MRERVVHLVASVLLGSPDERQAEARPLLARAVEGLPDGEAARALRSFFDRTAGTPVRELAAEHADAFSARRHSSPRLTFYLAATSRERGLALRRFTAAYESAGFRPAPEEPPDHLAAVCELSARGGTEAALTLLREHRPGIEVLHRSLSTRDSPYADVVAAVLATLRPRTP